MPRAIAHVALRLGPLDDYAVRVAWISCLCVGIISVAVYHLSSSLIPSRVTRILLAAIPALLPAAPFEVLGNTANLHWYMLWLAPWLLLRRPHGWPAAVGLAVAAFVAATTEIQTAAFLPVAVWAAVRDRRRIAAGIGLTAGVSLQFATFVIFPRTTSPDVVPWDPWSVVIGWLLQGGMSLVQPSSVAVGAIWNFFGGWVLVVPALVVVTVLAVAWRAGREYRWGALGCVVASGVFWAAAQILNNRAFLNFSLLTSEEWSRFGYVRYAVVPGMFLLGAAAFAAGGAAPGRPSSEDAVGTRALRSAAVTGAAAVVMLAHYFPTYSARSDGPVWSSQIAVARALCEAEPGREFASALVAPAGWDLEEVPLPCFRL
ncbi:hypothetical protein [Sinomonas mesophila]|uniref:hypothetical protein n=1 Tax=Sinomonas mesophila TaxID=1531955 RepID=UPI000985E6EE|nr:hypothetical protein [Sinomonas mesophila]